MYAHVRDKLLIECIKFWLPYKYLNSYLLVTVHLLVPYYFESFKMLQKDIRTSINYYHCLLVQATDSLIVFFIDPKFITNKLSFKIRIKFIFNDDISFSKKALFSGNKAAFSSIHICLKLSPLKELLSRKCASCFIHILIVTLPIYYFTKILTISLSIIKYTKYFRYINY